MSLFPPKFNPQLDFIAKLAKSLLDDEQGISEKAYNALVEVIQYRASAEEEQICRLLLQQVRATEGRYYIPKHEHDSSDDYCSLCGEPQGQMREMIEGEIQDQLDLMI